MNNNILNSNTNQRSRILKTLQNKITADFLKLTATWLIAAAIYILAIFTFIGFKAQTSAPHRTSGISGVFEMIMMLLAGISMWHVTSKSRVYLLFGTSRKDTAQVYLFAAVKISVISGVLLGLAAMGARHFGAGKTRIFIDFYGLEHLIKYFAAESTLMYSLKTAALAFFASFFAIGTGFLMGNMHLRIPGTVKIFILMAFFFLSAMGAMKVPMEGLAAGVAYLNSSVPAHLIFLAALGAICFVPEYMFD